MTNQNGAINIQSGANVGIGYVDLMMNQMIMEQLKSINSTGGFTIGTVITLIIIMSLTEIKPLAGEFIKYIIIKTKEYVSYYGQLFLEYFTFYVLQNVKIIFNYIISFCENIKNKIQKQKDTNKNFQEEKKDDSFNYSIKWSPKIQSCIIFLKYIINNENCSYEKEHECEISSDTYNIRYKNIKFKKNDWILFVPDMNIEFKNNSIISYESKQHFTEFDFGSKDDPTCLCSLITENTKESAKLKKYVQMLNYCLQIKQHGNNDEYFYVPFVDMEIKKKYFDPDIFLKSYPDNIESTTWCSEGICAFLLKYKYKNINIITVLFELILINSGYLQIPFTTEDPYYKNVIKLKGIKIKELNLNVEFPEYQKINLKNIKLDKFNKNINSFVPEPNKYISDLLDNTDFALALNIKSLKKIDYESEFSKFLEEIWENYEKSKDPNKKEKINVFELKLKREQKETIKDNPKYTEYMTNLDDIKHKFTSKEDHIDSDKDTDDKKKEKTQNKPIIENQINPHIQYNHNPYIQYQPFQSFQPQKSYKELLVEKIR
jgi:hypothetical protein